MYIETARARRKTLTYSRCRRCALGNRKRTAARVEAALKRRVMAHAN